MLKKPLVSDGRRPDPFSEAAGAANRPEQRPPRITDPAEIERLVRSHGRWWHEIEVAPGIVTPGQDSNRMKLPLLDGIGLPRDLRGLRALDVGCSDGYFAFEMEKRGATVLAIDFVPETYTGFAIAKRILGSSVEYRMDNVYNLSPESYGTFDIVLFMGVLYHLRNPLGGLDAVRSVLKEGGLLFVGTMMIDEYLLLPDRTVTRLADVSPLLSSVPLWQAFPGSTLNGDFTNCFAPNRAALIAALEEAQFRVDEVSTVSMGGYARAVAVHDALAAKYQRLDTRLRATPFDPAVPYFLDEEGYAHEVTKLRADPPTPSAHGRKRTWRRKTFFDPLHRQEVVARIGGLSPASERRWGRMTAPRMVAHLRDQMSHCLGDRPCTPVPSILRWAPLRHASIYWIPWPKGRAKGPPDAFVTQPGSWPDDVANLLDLVDRFGARDPQAPWPNHAIFGPMRGVDWGYFCYKHFDHHLRQFGQ